MTKQIKNHVALADLENKAQEFISLTFASSEEELRKSRQRYPKSRTSRDTALAATALAVQGSIKAFLAVVKIGNE